MKKEIEDEACSVLAGYCSFVPDVDSNNTADIDLPFWDMLRPHIRERAKEALKKRKRRQ